MTSYTDLRAQLGSLKRELGIERKARMDGDTAIGAWTTMIRDELGLDVVTVGYARQAVRALKERAGE